MRNSLPSKQRVTGSSPVGIAISKTATVARFGQTSPLKSRNPSFILIHDNPGQNHPLIRGIFGECR
jgi:hypothetical protein